MKATKKYEYGPEAQTDRDYESLTQKQRNGVKAIVEANPEASDREIGEDAGIHGSYVGYIRKNFPHIISKRRGLKQVAADGGEKLMTIQLTSTEVWKTMQMVDDEISQKIWEQTRG